MKNSTELTYTKSFARPFCYGIKWWKQLGWQFLCPMCVPFPPTSHLMQNSNWCGKILCVEATLMNLSGTGIILSSPVQCIQIIYTNYAPSSTLILMVISYLYILCIWTLQQKKHCTQMMSCSNIYVTKITYLLVLECMDTALEFKVVVCSCVLLPCTPTKVTHGNQSSISVWPSWPRAL